MAKILCVISGLTSISNSTSELLNRLQDLGHDVGYATSGDFEKYNSNSRFTYYPLAKLRYFEPNIISSKELPYKSKRRLNRILYSRKLRTLLQGKLKEDLSIYGQVLDNFKPDLVFVDNEMPHYTAFTYHRKISLYIISPWFTELSSSNFPPLDSDFIPNNSVSSKIKCKTQWVKRRLVIWKRTIYDALRFNTSHNSIVRNYIKSAIGSDFGGINQNLFLKHMYNFKNFKIFHTTYEELDWPSAQFKNNYYLGGLVNKDREHTIDNEIMRSLHDIIELKKSKGFKLICLSFSTMKTKKNKSSQILINRIAKAISNNPNWIGVIGGQNEWIQKGVNPYANVFCFEWLPISNVLKHTDCSISHGGIGMIHECVEYNVPMLLYSGNKYDQNGNVARMKFHNLAVVGNESKDSVADIGENIILAMQSKAIVSNMQSLTSKETKERYLKKLEASLNEKLEQQAY
jgi:zeaxanthin glucosyltransferase